MRDFLSEEKQLCAEIEELCITDPDSAHALIDGVIADCDEACDRAQSAAASRICCRFLMHRKMKSRLVDTLKTDDGLRKAIFGELNTYKYSLVFLFRRLIRLNETELTDELLSLLKNNPYRDDSAKDYSDRWSLRFIIDEALRAPDDYLDLSEENKNVIDEARKRTLITEGTEEL